MQQKTKYAVIISGGWFFIAITILGIDITSNYDAWFFRLLGNLSLWCSPVIIYWLCIWLWGHVPLPKVMLPNKIKERFPHVIAALALINITRVLGITSGIQDIDTAILASSAIGLMSFIVGYSLSVWLFRQLNSELWKIATGLYVIVLLVSVGLLINQSHTQRVQAKYQIKQQTKQLSDDIWNSLSKEDKERLKREMKNPYEDAASQLKEELK